MRLLSRMWQPTVAIPGGGADNLCKSQRLLWECGLVGAAGPGLHNLLPLAQRAARKLERLVAHAFESVGGERVSLPALVPAALWQQSGRLGGAAGGGAAARAELLTLTDRNDKQYLLAPTHEESVTALLAAAGVLSYKQLPILLYQMGEKYRDETRPKHGLLRARQFRMADLYGAHASARQAARTYADVTAAYRALFQQLQLHVHRVAAPAGTMGGQLSHEWQLPAAIGEDAIDVCPSCSHARLSNQTEGDGTCDKCGSSMNTVNSIEVGHTFVLGSRYSEPMRALLSTKEGSTQPILMTCYGIGLTRLLAASVEALSTDTGLVWPPCIAPFSTVVIGPKEGSKEESALRPYTAQQVCSALALATSAAAPAPPGAEDDVLLDDRHQLSVGRRLHEAEKAGYPTIVVLGRALLQPQPAAEVRRRAGATAHYHVTTVPLAHIHTAYTHTHQHQQQCDTPTL